MKSVCPARTHAHVLILNKFNVDNLKQVLENIRAQIDGAISPESCSATSAAPSGAGDNSPGGDENNTGGE